MVAAVPIARVVRSGLEESVHLGHVAVCDVDGRLVARAGDADRELFIRSCTKPLQAAVSLAAIGDEALPDREIAVMCASHNGEPVHLGAVRALLERAGLGPEALLTPPSYPLDDDEMARSQHRHPLVQRLLGQARRHAARLRASRLGPRHVPTPLPPFAAAGARAPSNAPPASTTSGSASTGAACPCTACPCARSRRSTRGSACPSVSASSRPSAARAIEAMLAEPYLVGGRNRFDTDAHAGRSRSRGRRKAPRRSSARPPRRSGLGVALKVADGGFRAAGPAMVEVLAQLDALDADERKALRGLVRARRAGRWPSRWARSSPS